MASLSTYQVAMETVNHAEYNKDIVESKHLLGWIFGSYKWEVDEDFAFRFAKKVWNLDVVAIITMLVHKYTEYNQYYLLKKKSMK